LALKIVQAGEAVLRALARSLTREEILSRQTQDLVEEMRAAMRAAPGVGLAAPQVGVAQQIAVIEDRSEYHAKATPEQLVERGRRHVPFHALINPRIVSQDGATVEFFEGCLSVEGYTAIVPRSWRVTVEFLNEHAEPARIEAEGWYARILQHEIDHLNGILYIDRMHTRTFCNMENYERLWKGVSTQRAWQELGGRTSKG
jgi:peptide deformylase